jgi:mono/diheme cytochrome c family protein
MFSLVVRRALRTMKGEPGELSSETMRTGAVFSRPWRSRIWVGTALAVWTSGFALTTTSRAQARTEPSRTVWEGVYTDAQATRGRGLYAQHCAECHGADLQGGEGKPLSGDRFWEDWQETSVDYLLGQISRNMPRSEDGSLKGTLGMPTYTDIVAHVLKTNGFPRGKTS